MNDTLEIPQRQPEVGAEETAWQTPEFTVG